MAYLLKFKMPIVNLSNEQDIHSKLAHSLVLVIFQAFQNVSFYLFPDQKLVFPKLKPTRLA